MDFDQAKKKSHKLRWKTDYCHEGEQCWCRIIKCEEPLMYSKFDYFDQEEYIIIQDGQLNKDTAEHIVKLHNESLLKTKKQNNSTVTEQNPVQLYFDGACGPYNPGGHIGCGVLIKDKNGDVIHTISRQYSPDEFGGNTSNNVAEYQAFILGMQWCIDNGISDVDVFGDSQLVINQMLGKYKIKNGLYAEKAREAISMIKNFNKITFTHILRNFNSQADELSKIVIDGWNSQLDSMKFQSKRKSKGLFNSTGENKVKPKVNKIPNLNQSDSTNPEKVAEYQKMLQERMNGIQPKRVDEFTNEEWKAKKSILKAGHKRRATKANGKTFTLSSGSANQKRNPPKGGWV